MSFIGKQPTLNRIKYSPLSADPANPTEGDIFYSDGTSRSEGLWVYKNLAWTPVSDASGGLDVFYTEDFEVNTASSYTTGNNATFLGAGAIVGTLADETASPISKRRSLKYTQASGSLNDYFVSPVIDIDLKQAGNDAGFTSYFTYTGDADDLKLVCYDVTNTTIISSDLDLIPSASNPTRFVIGSGFHIPSGVTQLQWGVQVVVENIGAVLTIDDIEMSTDPFVKVNLQEENVYSARIANNGTATITSQSDEVNPAIASVSRTATGHVDIVFTTDFFSEPPSITTTCESDTDAYTVLRTAVTTTGVTVGVLNDAGSAQDVDFTIITQRQSSDYKAPTENAVTPVKNNANNFSARIANNGTATITSQGGKNEKVESAIASVSRTATGVVVLTFTTDFFSEQPAIVATCIEPLSNKPSCKITALGSDAATIETFNDAGTNQDQDFTLSISRQGADEKSAIILGALPTDLTQTKYLTADTTSSTTMSDLTFTGLQVGKNYRIDLQSVFSHVADNGEASISITHNAAVIGKSIMDTTSNASNGVCGFSSSVIFTATASTVTFVSVAGATASILGNSTGSETFAQITELNNTKVTTKF
jgi:hypothetical protein